MADNERINAYDILLIGRPDGIDVESCYIRRGHVFIVLLNMAVIGAVIVVAVTLTLIAIGLIIGSLVRSSLAKKKNKKTLKIGLWIGIAMIIIPWILVAVLVVSVNVSDAENNRWLPGREGLATVIIDQDADELYDMMADYVVDEDDISVDDVEAFLDSCSIGNMSDEDLDRYTRMSSQDNHYRYYTSEENGRAQTCFQYHMYDVNDEGGDIYITGVDGDVQGEEYVGIYYVTYTLDGETISIGRQPPSER